MWRPAVKRERVGRRDVSRRAVSRRVVDRRVVDRPARSVGANTTDIYTEWRNEMASVQSDDPMRTEPAPRVTETPDNRAMSLMYQYDWLANMTSWDDDAQKFYERSIGVISNGFDVGKRPSALYLASDLPTQAAIQYGTEERGGYVELDYGVSGNVVAMTVRAQCADPVPSSWSTVPPTCYDNRSLSLDARRTHLRNNCVCAKEQHYQYRWDELNRLSEARRYDREGSGTWDLAARQRYRYDGANQRTVKQTLDVEYVTGTAANGLTPDADLNVERIALYVYGGDYERRGIVRDDYAETYIENPDGSTETQFLVGGARVVQTDPGAGQGEGGGLLHPDDRVTVAITDLIGTTSAVIDLVSGALVETSTYYPNGARETYRAPDTENVAAEPMGFTGKEADEEVGVTYFGERYLIPRIGRWATPDPLAIHAAGGGESLNSYHYVSGNLLQARDPLGLEGAHASATPAPEGVPRITPDGTRSAGDAHLWAITPDGTPMQPPASCAEASPNCFQDFVNSARGQHADVYWYKGKAPTTAAPPSAPHQGNDDAAPLTGPPSTGIGSEGPGRGLNVPDPLGDNDPNSRGGVIGGMCREDCVNPGAAGVAVGVVNKIKDTADAAVAATQVVKKALKAGIAGIRRALPNTAPPNLTPLRAGRRGAFREAKRQSGVPVSQQPSRVGPNLDRRGDVQPGRNYEFEIPVEGGGSRRVRIREDSAGHDFGPGDPQNRGPHFNDEAGNHYDY